MSAGHHEGDFGHTHKLHHYSIPSPGLLTLGHHRTTRPTTTRRLALRVPPTTRRAPTSSRRTPLFSVNLPLSVLFSPFLSFWLSARFFGGAGGREFLAAVCWVRGGRFGLPTVRGLLPGVLVLALSSNVPLGDQKEKERKFIVLNCKSKQK